MSEAKNAVAAVNADRAGEEYVSVRLFKDSEDRAHGTPKQSVEHGGEGGGPLIIQWRDAGS